MKNYCFKTVKIEKSIVAQNKYRCLSKLNPNIATVPGTIAPLIYRSTKTNAYLLDVKTDNIEVTRFIGNTLIQAEKSLFPNDRFLFALLYECELGKAIANDTPMTLLLDVAVDYKSAGFYTETSDGYLTNAIKAPGFYAWRALRNCRHTLRGSGRYEPTMVKDPPFYFTQSCLMINDFLAVKQAKNDDFVGLDVAFGRVRGNPLKHVYMGAVSSANYQTDALGNIGLHRRGNLYKGAFDNYYKSLSILWPLMSGRQFDKDGILIEAPRVAANGIPNLVTEFKAQRRAAYTKAGNSEVFKTRLVVMLSDYIAEFCRFINDIQRWGHNLNFDVGGFRRSKALYLRAERVLRLISAYFPRELPLPGNLSFDALSTTTPVSAAETLVLGNRFQSSAECWDRLVLLVDWMRRNYVDYKLSDAIPNYVRVEPDTRANEFEYLGLGRYGRFFPDNGPSPTPQAQAYLETLKKQAVPQGKSQLNFGDYQNFEHREFPPYTTHGVWITPPQIWHLPRNGGLSAAWLVGHAIESYKYIRTTGHPAYRIERPWSDYNQWLEQTSEIAADIEEVYLSFQFNALAFAELLAHFLTIIDSKPRATVNRKAGKLPGEIAVSDEQKKNRKRTHPSALKPQAPDNREEGGLQEIEVPTEPFPDFKPLQIDTRAIILRCAKDTTKQDEDEQEEEDKKRKAANNQADRDAFDQQQDEIERRKIKAQEKPRFKWRNEIDDLTPEQRRSERISLYNEIANNLNTALDVVDAVDTAISGFAILACPPSTPLVVGQKVAFKTGTSGAKKAVRRLAEKAALDWPDLPEFDDATAETEIDSPELPSAPQGEVPRPRVRHKYKPPRKDDTPDFTGDEPDPRDWEPCPKSPFEYMTDGTYRVRNPIPSPSNGVDLQIIEEYEPGGSRTLVQQGLKYFDDVIESAFDCLDFPERNPQERYRCIRAQKRVPRQ